MLIILCCGVVWAQNTQREPIQGGVTNPVTQHEADYNSDQKPLSEMIRKKKRKPETSITAQPADATPAKPASTTESDQTSSTSTK